MSDLPSCEFSGLDSISFLLEIFKAARIQILKERLKCAIAYANYKNKPNRTSIFGVKLKDGPKYPIPDDYENLDEWWKSCPPPDSMFASIEAGLYNDEGTLKIIDDFIAANEKSDILFTYRISTKSYTNILKLAEEYKSTNKGSN